MRSNRNILLTETPDEISYSALVTAITEKIKNSGELISCGDVSGLRTAINAAEKKRG